MRFSQTFLYELQVKRLLAVLHTSCAHIIVAAPCAKKLFTGLLRPVSSARTKHISALLSPTLQQLLA